MFEIPDEAFFKQASNEETLELVSKIIDFEGTESVNLDAALLRQTKIFKFLQGKLSEQASINQKIQDKLDDTKILMSRFYDGKLSPEVYKQKKPKFTPSTKSELELIVKRDPLVSKIAEELRISERNLQIIEDGLWQLRQRPNIIKSAIEWRRYIETGM